MRFSCRSHQSDLMVFCSLCMERCVQRIPTMVTVRFCRSCALKLGLIAPSSLLMICTPISPPGALPFAMPWSGITPHHMWITVPLEHELRVYCSGRSEQGNGQE